MKWFFSTGILVMLSTACHTRTETDEFVRLERRSAGFTLELDRQQFKNHGYDTWHKKRNAPFTDSLTDLLHRYAQTASSPTCTWQNLLHLRQRAETYVATRRKQPRSNIPQLDSTLSVDFLKSNLYVFMSLYLYKNIGQNAQWEPRYVYRFAPVTVVHRNGNTLCGNARLGCFFPGVKVLCLPLADTAGTHRIHSLGPVWLQIRTEQPLQKLTRKRDGTYAVEYLQPISDVEEYAHHIVLQTVQKPATPCE